MTPSSTKMQMFLLVFSGCTCSCDLVVAQTSSLLWQHAFGGCDNDEITCVIQTSDGGLLAVGSTFSADGDVSKNYGGADAWILKLNVSGNLEWETSVGGNFDDYAYGVTQTLDGNYLVVGKTNSTSGILSDGFGLYDGWLAKIMGDGKISWTKVLGSGGEDCFNTVFENEDGSIMVAGSISLGEDLSNDLNHSDYLLMKTNAKGKALWAKSYGGSDADILSSAASAPGGNFLLCGYTSSRDGDLAGHKGTRDVWIIKLDQNGIMYWQKTVGKCQKGNSALCSLTSDGGFLISGCNLFPANSTASNPASSKNGCMIAKLTNGGATEWEFTLPENNHEQYKELSCIETKDGGYIIGGIVRHFDTANGDIKQQIFTMKLNTKRVIEWNQTVSRGRKNLQAVFLQTADTSYVLAGNNMFFFQEDCSKLGFEDFCIVKMAYQPAVTISKNK